MSAAEHLKRLENLENQLISGNISDNQFAVRAQELRENKDF